MVFKIAIIDDDYSTLVTKIELLKVDTEQIFEALEDENSPEYSEVFEKLKDENLKFSSTEDLIGYLNCQDKFNKLPASIKKLKEKVDSRKLMLIEPVRRIENWLLEHNKEILINKFHNMHQFIEEIKTNEYDLILVDYLLVNDSENETIPFIIKIKESFDVLNKSPSFILISSHTDKINRDFLDIKARLNMTSSRFRIMAKSSDDEYIHELKWKETINQIFKQKPLVVDIERFINAWMQKFQEASGNLSRTLWALDAHSLDVLRRTAEADHISLSEYFSEVIFRKVLAEFEHSLTKEPECVHDLGSKLSDLLSHHEALSPGHEVEDSRSLIKDLLRDSSWHRQNWFLHKTPYPISSPNDDAELKKSTATAQFLWLKKNLRFGSVLENVKTKTLLLNLTQPCDITHLNFSHIDENNFLMMHGIFSDLGDHGDRDKKDKQALSTTFKHGESWHNIHWNLSRPQTPPISNFMKEFQNYKIIGQLRNEQTQYVLNRYITKISRVATIRIPKLHDFGFIVLQNMKNDVKTLQHGNAHGLENGKDSITINFDLDAVNELCNHFGKQCLDNLIQGINIKKKSKMPSNSTVDNVIILEGITDLEKAKDLALASHSNNIKGVKNPFIFFYKK